MAAIRLSAIILVLGGVLTLQSGCSIGPKVIRCNMDRYNEAVVTSENEQFLLNLVRIRYRETAKTLGVSQVTSQYTLDTIAPFGGSLTHFARAAATTSALPLGVLSFGPFSGRLTDVPTVSFIPQSGADFNRGLLVPIAVERLVLLANTGWDLELVLRLIVQNLNGVENMAHVIAQLPENRPARHSADFNELAALLGKLHHFNKLQLGPDPNPVLSSSVGDYVLKDPEKPKAKVKDKAADKDTVPDADKNVGLEVKGSDLISAADKHYKFCQEKKDGKDVIVLRNTVGGFIMAVDADTVQSPEFQRAMQLLNVLPSAEDSLTRRIMFRVLPPDAAPAKRQANDIFVGTRNIIGCSVFVGKGIEIPEAHYMQGLVEPGIDENGAPFDWTTVTEGLFRVRVDKCRPKCAYVAVKHRGYWFYIADDDLPTKATFGLLKEMFDVQIAPGLSTAPILTLSAGGGTTR